MSTIITTKRFFFFNKVQYFEKSFITYWCWFEEKIQSYFSYICAFMFRERERESYRTISKFSSWYAERNNVLCNLIDRRDFSYFLHLSWHDLEDYILAHLGTVVSLCSFQKTSQYIYKIFDHVLAFENNLQLHRQCTHEVVGDVFHV